MGGTQIFVVGMLTLRPQSMFQLGDCFFFFFKILSVSNAVQCLEFGVSVLILNFSSVQFSHSVMSTSLQSHGLQHARPRYPSPVPSVYSKSYPLSQ